jgi:acyl carrier protein
MRDQIYEAIVKAVNELNTDLHYDSLRSPSPETPLYGGASELDSLSLVLLISSVEEAVAEKLGVHVILASEKAMSMRHSPYRTIATLADFVEAELATT